LGQLLDLLTAPEDTVDLSKFSLEAHSFIVTYKTAFYSFYLPVALAMYMAGISDEADLKQAKDVLIPLGEYFQIQVLQIKISPPPPFPFLCRIGGTGF
jgi:farnesyl diphosphate synthase